MLGVCLVDGTQDVLLSRLKNKKRKISFVFRTVCTIFDVSCSAIGRLLFGVYSVNAYLCRLKGKQVRILYSPAAVSSLVMLRSVSFATVFYRWEGERSE